MLTLIRLKNRILGFFFPSLIARQNAKLFLTPRKYNLKDWEEEAEILGQRIIFGRSLSGLRWGASESRILLVHGWESRATQMHGIAQELVGQGYEVIAIDGPMHGQSKSERSNPLEFAKAIEAANKAYGPFYGAVGHSMGACALAIAYAEGVNLGRYALVSSPACIYDVLRGFAKFMGLNLRSTHKFVDCIEEEVGRSSKELDVGKLMQGHDEDILLVHAKDDIEIPYHSLPRIKSQLSKVKTLSPSGLGHRKILRNEKVAQAISQFMQDGKVVEIPIKQFI